LREQFLTKSEPSSNFERNNSSIFAKENLETSSKCFPTTSSPLLRQSCLSGIVFYTNTQLSFTSDEHRTTALSLGPPFRIVVQDQLHLPNNVKWYLASSARRVLGTANAGVYAFGTNTPSGEIWTNGARVCIFTSVLLVISLACLKQIFSCSTTFPYPNL
jgi:hypothetical protein